ncbi:unnamed protein product [Closterium sp. NIES-65]|nr:unnamed protein product [Closterium sp. NIES-65]
MLNGMVSLSFVTHVLLSAAPLSSRTHKHNGRNRLSYEQFSAFLANIKELNSSSSFFPLNRLSYEQFSAFLANIKELNAHRQSREVRLSPTMSPPLLPHTDHTPSSPPTHGPHPLLSSLTRTTPPPFFPTPYPFFPTPYAFFPTPYPFFPTAPRFSHTLPPFTPLSSSSPPHPLHLPMLSNHFPSRSSSPSFWFPSSCSSLVLRSPQPPSFLPHSSSPTPSILSFPSFANTKFLETLRKADEIFGPDNKDLYTAFDGLLSRHLPS